MTHVNNRATMARFQMSRPYNYRSNGGCGYGAQNYGSVFNHYGYGRPIGTPSGSNMFKAAMITNIVCQSLNSAMNLTGAILGWCGIGGGAQQTTTTTTVSDQAASDLKFLQDTLKPQGTKSYAIQPQGNGKFTVTITDTAGDNSVITGTKDEILAATGYTKPGEKTKFQRAEIRDNVQTALTAAMDANASADKKIELPEGYQITNSFDVAADGTVTVKIEPKDSSKGQRTIEVTGKADEIVGKVKAECDKVNREQAEAKRAQQAKEQATNEVKQEIQTAGGDAKVNLPKSYNLNGMTVTKGSDGQYTITVPAGNGSFVEPITVKGANAAKAVEALVAECKKAQKAEAETFITKNKDNINYTAPEGYHIETSGTDKNGNTKMTFVLVKDADNSKQYCYSTDDLAGAIHSAQMQIDIAKGPQLVVDHPTSSELIGTSKTIRSGVPKREYEYNYTYKDSKGNEVAHEYSGPDRARVVVFGSNGNYTKRVVNADQLKSDESRTRMITSDYGDIQLSSSELLDKNGKMVVKYENGKYFTAKGKEVSEAQVMKYMEKHSGLKIVSHFATEQADETESAESATPVEGQDSKGKKQVAETTVEDFAAKFTELRNNQGSMDRVTLSQQIIEIKASARTEKCQQQLRQQLGDPSMKLNMPSEDYKLEDGTRVICRAVSANGKVLWEIQNVVPPVGVEV